MGLSCKNLGSRKIQRLFSQRYQQAVERPKECAKMASPGLHSLREHLCILWMCGKPGPAPQADAPGQADRSYSQAAWGVFQSAVRVVPCTVGCQELSLRLFQSCRAQEHRPPGRQSQESKKHPLWAVHECQLQQSNGRDLGQAVPTDFSMWWKSAGAEHALAKGRCSDCACPPVIARQKQSAKRAPGSTSVPGESPNRPLPIGRQFKIRE